ncbi:MAG: N-acetylmuramoyl-L-alanine amidase [Planctomycetes bacterium]|nr:N-acetylmuramoyl-L-alanine amidase [Planctomycetota bacterium]
MVCKMSSPAYRRPMLIADSDKVNHGWSKYAALAAAWVCPAAIVLLTLAIGSCERPQNNLAAIVRPNPPVVPQKRQWQYIVIHHSATPSGNAAAFDREHRARGWDELGYHFVIDNGRGGPDGKIEVGQRWLGQRQGAHTGNTPDDAYNQHGIGICLVGDFTRSKPTKAQIASLTKLVKKLMADNSIGPQNVTGHGEAPGARTSCPGEWLDAFRTGTFGLASGSPR